jgi:hypothetical protein
MPKVHAAASFQGSFLACRLLLGGHTTHSRSSRPQRVWTEAHLICGLSEHVCVACDCGRPLVSVWLLTRSVDRTCIMLRVWGLFRRCP